MDPTTLLSPFEIAKRVGIPEATIRWWCRTGKIGTIDDEGHFVPLQQINPIGRRWVWGIPAHLVPTIKDALENGTSLSNPHKGMFHLPQRTRPLFSRWCTHKDEGRRCNQVQLPDSEFCKKHGPQLIETEERETDAK